MNHNIVDEKAMLIRNYTVQKIDSKNCILPIPPLPWQPCQQQRKYFDTHDGSTKRGGNLKPEATLKDGMGKRRRSKKEKLLCYEQES
jgi:hypothetical protein